MVTVDAVGTVLAHNERAGALLMRVRAGVAFGEIAPSWLAEAHRLRVAGDAGEEPPLWAAGWIGGRWVRALAGPDTGGAVTWWLIGDDKPDGATGGLDATTGELNGSGGGPAGPAGERSRTAEELARERARVGLLREVSYELQGAPNVEQCRAAIVRRAALHLADTAVLVSAGDGRTFPVTRCANGKAVTQERIALDPGRVPGLAEALRGLPVVASDWIDPRQLPRWTMPDDSADGATEVGALMVVPLAGHGARTGALILLRHRPATFTAAEESFAALFAARAGAALSLAQIHAHQAQVAAVLTRGLLPPVLGRVHGIDFSGRYRAAGAGERVGGDFYDVYPADTSAAESVAVLGDVCGNGLEAAVVTGAIRTSLRALLPFAADHSRLLTLLNTALLPTHQTPFVTLVLVSARRRGRRVRLRISSAGHPTPLIVRTSGRVEEAPTAGTLIGAVADLEFVTAEVTLRPGETCLLYSDGITEARGGPLGESMFGEDRLRTVLAQCAGTPAEVVTERVQMIAEQWVGEGSHDDMALLAIGAPRNTPSTPVHEKDQRR
ncbi:MULTISPECIES: PP2C family protein-serine/threonine phosphatase [unclassified Streptomyces]|uniref:PP2C family protein-serine/threonine phosphatase n=1 Tax=unclassified Streptomyces TaxID=2593676 RepID=UPI000378FC2B|nr:PP2C family protein-serine/threonine phosphatase [Streptomyces sp. HmicA12]